MKRINATAHRMTAPMVFGAMLGAVFAIPALLVAILSSGAGHGSYVLARALFPFSMLLILVEGVIGPISIAVALFQYPLYGAMIGWSIASKNTRTIYSVAAVHFFAALLCFTGLLPSFS